MNLILSSIHVGKVFFDNNYLLLSVKWKISKKTKRNEEAKKKKEEIIDVVRVIESYHILVVVQN